MTDPDNMPVTREELVEQCTCAEVEGEDPECALHGIKTDWALENTNVLDWQDMLIDARSELAQANARIAALSEHPAGIAAAAMVEGANLPADVVELVIAARSVAFSGLFDGSDADQRTAIRRLDRASEAFAARVPWENQPEDEDHSEQGSAADLIARARQYSAALRRDGADKPDEVPRIAIDLANVIDDLAEALSPEPPSDEWARAIEADDATVERVAVAIHEAADNPFSTPIGDDNFMRPMRLRQALAAIRALSPAAGRDGEGDRG